MPMNEETIRNATIALSIDVTAKAQLIDAAVSRYLAAKAELDAAFVDLANCMGVSVGGLLVNGDAWNATE
jgi:hypothetical protein